MKYNQEPLKFDLAVIILRLDKHQLSYHKKNEKNMEQKKNNRDIYFVSFNYYVRCINNANEIPIWVFRQRANEPQYIYYIYIFMLRSLVTNYRCIE